MENKEEVRCDECLKKPNQCIVCKQDTLNKAYGDYLKWFHDDILLCKNDYDEKSLGISYPFFINLLGQGYDSNKETIMIIGQETYGYPSSHWKEHLSGGWQGGYSQKTLQDILKINEICAKLFAFPYLPEVNKNEWGCGLRTELHNNIPDECIKHHYNGFFWGFMKIFRKNTQKNIVWSNIIRFDQNSRALTLKFFNQIKSSGKFKEFIDNHVDILRCEIEAIKPNKVIFLSNPNEIDSIYNMIIKKAIYPEKNIEDIKKDIIGYPEIENKSFIRQIKNVTINGVKPIILQTYHPNHMFGRISKNIKQLIYHKYYKNNYSNLNEYKEYIIRAIHSVE